MFDITTCRDFYRKLKADSEDFAKEQDSGRLALNCIITAYHLHEWVWGDWLKTDYAAWKQLGIKDKDSFVAWIERECPAFTTVQDLANGAKHFIRSGSEEIEGFPRHEISFGARNDSNVGRYAGVQVITHDGI